MPVSDATTETTQTVDTPAVEAPAVVSEEPTESPPAALADLPGADTFDWDKWDSKHDSLPEHVRPWAQRFETHYSKSALAQRQEAEQLKAVYESLMEGRDDPRLKELQKEIETHSISSREAKARISTLEAEYKAYVDSVTAHFDQQSTAAAEAFQKQNAWIFESEDLSNLGSELIEKDGFEPNDLPVLLRMPEPLLKEVRSIHKELTDKGAKGVSQHAITLARSKMKLSDHNPSAGLVAGATTPTAAPTDALKREGMTFQEKQDLYLESNLRRLGRR